MLGLVAQIPFRIRAVKGGVAPWKRIFNDPVLKTMDEICCVRNADIGAFYGWLECRPVSKELSSGWEEALLASGHAPITVNSMLSAINGFSTFLGRTDCRVKFLRVQRRVFRDASRDSDS